MCLTVSLVIHVIALLQPWNLMAVSNNRESMPDSIPIKLLGDNDLPKELVAQDEGKAQEQQEGLSFETEGDVSAGYMDLLKSRIFNSWEYPAEAVNTGREGVVKIMFVLDAAGRLTDIGVVKSSGYETLDAAAVDAIAKAGPFGPFTDDIEGQSLKITGSFCYVLE